MTDRKKIVAVDMDDTILYLMKAIHKHHNEKYPTHQVDWADVVPFDYTVYHPDFDIMEYFLEEGIFFNLEIMDEYVIEELKKIHEKYDLIIVTSAFPESVVDKWRWIQKFLPFIPFKNFITASRKDLIQADILIDDAKHNIEDWVKTGRPALVPNHHWNQQLGELEGVTMIYGWHGVTEIINHILGE